jgi:hypothetical protein
MNNSTDQSVFDGIVKRLETWHRWTLVEDVRDAEVIITLTVRLHELWVAGCRASTDSTGRSTCDVERS